MTRSKLICIDLDGTLLNKDKIVIEENKKSIVEALEKNNKVYIVTGRPYVFAKYIASSIDPRVGIVSFNGAVYHTDSDVITSLDEHGIKRIFQSIEGLDMHVMFKTIDHVFSNKTIPLEFEYKNLGMQTTIGFTNVHTHPIIKVLMLKGQVDDVLFENLALKLGAHFEVSYYKNKGLELISKGSNKGVAVLALSKYLNITKEDIIAFGDDVNDISMFNVAGVSVSPSSANADIREKSSFVSLDANEASIAHALRHLNITTM